MKMSLAVTVDGEAEEVLTWFTDHFGGEIARTSSVGSTAADEWTDDLADRFVRRVSPIARDLLWVLAGSGPRGADDRDLEERSGWDPSQIEKAMIEASPGAFVSQSVEGLAGLLKVKPKGLGGVLSSFGSAENAGFPNPIDWNSGLQSYVMDAAVAAKIGAALNRFDPEKFPLDKGA